MKLTLPLLATCAAVLLVPAAAQAATLSYEGDALVYRADPGVRDSPGLSKDDAGLLTINEEGLKLAPGCTYDYVAHCPMPSRVVLYLGDGDDWQSFSSDYPAALPATVYGEDGKDQLQTYGADHVTLDGGNGDDLLKGWQSNDTLLGGPGNDEINGSGGDDHIEGGDGNDAISPDTYYGPGNDYVDGGPGIDKVDDWSIPSDAYHPPFSVTHGRRRQRRPSRRGRQHRQRREDRVACLRHAVGLKRRRRVHHLGEHRRGQLDALRQRRQRQADHRRLPGHARRRPRQ